MYTPSSDIAPPSTPPPAVFSDDTKQPSSPSSSPPGFPWDYDNATKPVPKPPQRTAFSALGKRKALSPTTDNPRPAKKQTAPAKHPEKGSLTQMQISLGQQVQKKCKTCGMEYIASSAEDRKLHDKYHKQNTEGYDLGKNFVRLARAANIFDGAREGDKICLVDGVEPASRQRRAQDVLDIVQRELGAVEISPEFDIRRRHYLYLRGTKCVGYLLTEPIEAARQVVPHKRDEDKVREKSRSPSEQPERDESRSTALSKLQQRKKAATEILKEAENSPIELSETVTMAKRGIARIWTSSTHRRQNIATALLDAALSSSGATWHDAESGDWHSSALVKDLVAFSQPTASGARLARKWFGRTYGWKVYVD